jgi:putative transposase
LPAAVNRKRALVGLDGCDLSIGRQCELLDLNRSTYYLPPAVESAENLRLMRLIVSVRRTASGSQRAAA